MNLYHLRYFVKLAHLQHYNKAAAELSITQPSLSHAIASLEKELGVALFERDGRNVILSKQGKYFLKDVERALDLLDNSVNSLRLSAAGEGRMDIGLLRTLGTDFVPGLMQGFLQSQPGKKIEFFMHIGITHDLVEGLKNRDYDLAFCSRAEGENGVTFIPVAKQGLVLIVPEGHPLQGKKSVLLEETLEYPQIAFTPTSGLRSIVDGLFRKIGRFPDIAYEVEEDEVIAGMVAHGFGIAVVPDMPMLDQLPVSQIQIRSPSWRRNFYLAYMTDQFQTNVVQRFIDYVINHVEL